MNLPALPPQEIPTLQFELGEKRRENETLAIWRPSANVGFLLRRCLCIRWRLLFGLAVRTSVLADGSFQKQSPGMAPGSGPEAGSCSSTLPHCWYHGAHLGSRVKAAASNSGHLVRNPDGFSIFLFASRSEKPSLTPVSLPHICDIFTGNSQLVFQTSGLQGWFAPPEAQGLY